ncbi:hypothetical protein K2173_000849 [Erythroxylum novogranatense]|uniref:Uncharacterized protein n=1 Tax=Erythroxylum novogranatense TaxID=1862640 RepID=A0AAV8S834_9ROSI|nr:hypothetical protein K2173_000849 [Erythroxylum novogranatense]
MESNNDDIHDYYVGDHQKSEEKGVSSHHERPMLSVEEEGNVFSLYSDFLTTPGFEGVSKFHQQQSNRSSFDKYSGSCVKTPAQHVLHIKELENVSKPSEGLTNMAPVSLERLNSSENRFRMLKQKQLVNSYDETADPVGRERLSTEEVVRVAGARYIQFADQRHSDFPTIQHPFGYALEGLSEEETRDVEIAHVLLSAAEKVGNQQLDSACRLLSRCELMACEKVNPVHRVANCFAEALREKIDKETGKFKEERPEIIPERDVLQGLSTDLAFLVCYQKVPINQATHLTAVQTIFENVESVRKLHIIDLEIRSGVQWSAMMQAIAGRGQPPVKHLKISAISRLGSENKTQEIGKYLENLAQALKIPFTFVPVYMLSLDDIKEEHFKIAPDESVVVFCDKILRTTVATPRSLENLMRVIKNLNPSLMVVVEVEANHNSPTFVERFIEALFYFSAYFDCIDTCMSEAVEQRTVIEAIFFHGIRNILTMEGRERTCRSVEMEVWRAFFARYKMVEMDSSESSRYQANLVLGKFPFGHLCSIKKDGKSLHFGWKGMPLLSLSAWKFSKEILGRIIV